MLFNSVLHHGEDVTFSLEGDRIPEFLKSSHKGDMFITTLRVRWFFDTVKFLTNILWNRRL